MSSAALFASGQFTGIVLTQSRRMFLGPIGQRGGPCRGSIRVKQVGHQPLDLFASDHDVAHDLAQTPSEHIADGGRDRNDEPAFANDRPNVLNQAAIGKVSGPMALMMQSLAP